MKLNDLNITHAQFICFNTILEMLEHTKKTGYNEYDFCVENIDGSYLYPSAIKVVGTSPLQAEIDAAEYLNMPLVKIHRKEKITDVVSQTIKVNYTEAQLNELRKLKVFFDNLRPQELSVKKLRKN